MISSPRNANALYFIFVSLIVSIKSVTIDTNYGPIVGTTANGINLFTAIPYAKAPVNELRFADPQETDTWSDPYPATTNPFLVPNCPQPCLGTCSPVISEDCLFLNIYTPDDAQHEVTSYTTMIWIHGGAYDRGSISVPLFDATNFVDFIGDIIIVSMNYRLGLLGSLYDNMYGTGIEGNFAFKDQQFAIKWVHDNIKFFGGDENNIIIFGESSGAQFVGLHLLYNNEYINGGIMQSPPFGIALRTPTTWYDAIEIFTDNVGCDDKIGDSVQLLDCWRSIDFADIISNQSNPLFSASWNNDLSIFTPTVKTSLLQKQPIHAFQKVNNNKKKYDIPPFIIGTNHDEYYYFIIDALKYVYTYDDLINEIDRIFGDNDKTQQVLNYYGITRLSPGITDNYLYDLAEISTKYTFKCAVRNILKKSKNIDNVYNYEFDVVDPIQNEITFQPNSPQCVNKSCHVNGLYYLMLAPYYVNLGAILPDTMAIGQDMQTFWSNWAKSLNPNDENDDTWKVYTNKKCKNKKRQFLSFQSVDQYITDSFKDNNEECEFLDSIGYAL